MSIEITPSLAYALVQWIRNNNPKGNEDTAQDLKSALCDLVDDNTMSRALIEKRIRAHLGSYDVSFSRSYIEVYDRGSVTLRIVDDNRSGHVTLDNSEFDSSEDITRAAGYAEELETSVWDDDAGEELIKKWFRLEA